MSDSQKLIEYAQNYLKHQPFDIVHDFEHHQLVVNNCMDIIEHEHLTPHLDVIITAAWWHDVEKSYQTANSADNTITFLKKTAVELGVEANFADQCCQTIIQHSFSQSQTNLEGRILFDADKIEYVNDGRIEKLVTDVIAHPHNYQSTHLQNMHDIWISRIQKVPEMMHFAYSKQVFLEKFNSTETILEKFQKAISS